MKEIKGKINTNFFKKVLIKICRMFGYELIDQSKFYIPTSKKYLNQNINQLELKYDNNKVWRKYYNSMLKNEYKKVFSMFDQKIYVQAPSFKYVLKWRSLQEKNNANNSHSKNIMNKFMLQIFIQHYEKITKWMMKTMPLKADILIKIDKNQKIKRLTKITKN